MSFGKTHLPPGGYSCSYRFETGCRMRVLLPAEDFNNVFITDETHETHVPTQQKKTHKQARLPHAHGNG